MLLDHVQKSVLLDHVQGQSGSKGGGREGTSAAAVLELGRGRGGFEV